MSVTEMTDAEREQAQAEYWDALGIGTEHNPIEDDSDATYIDPATGDYIAPPPPDVQTLEVVCRHILGNMKWDKTEGSLTPSQYSEATGMLRSGWDANLVEEAVHVLGSWGWFKHAGLIDNPPWEVTEEDWARLVELAPWNNPKLRKHNPRNRKTRNEKETDMTKTATKTAAPVKATPKAKVPVKAAPAKTTKKPATKTVQPEPKKKMTRGPGRPREERQKGVQAPTTPSPDVRDTSNAATLPPIPDVAVTAATEHRERGKVIVFPVRIPEARLDAVKDEADRLHMAYAGLINAAIEMLLNSTSAQKDMAMGAFHRKTSTSESAIVKQTLNRVTRTEVVVEDSWHAGAKVRTENGRWNVRCTDHDTTTGVGSKQAAFGMISIPWNWCDECRNLVGKLGVKSL